MNNIMLASVLALYKRLNDSPEFCQEFITKFITECPQQALNVANMPYATATDITFYVNGLTATISSGDYMLVRSLISDSRFVDAIRHLRAVYHWGLKDSKDICEYIRDHYNKES